MSWIKSLFSPPPPPTPEQVLADVRAQITAFRSEFSTRRMVRELEHKEDMRQLIKHCEKGAAAEAYALSRIMGRRMIHGKQEYALDERLMEMDAQFGKATDTMRLARITYTGVRAASRFLAGIPTKGFDKLTDAYKTMLDQLQVPGPGHG